MFDKTNQRGFTLIEAIITILLLSILSGISLTLMNSFKIKANQSTLVYTEQLQISSCFERIKAQSRFNNGYISNNEIETLVATCPGTPNLTFNKASKQITNNTNGTYTINITTDENSRCLESDELCLFTLKLKNTEIHHVFLHQP